MTNEIILLLLKDSFFSGIVFFSSGGESILPTILVYNEDYNIRQAMILAYLANSSGLIINWLFARLCILWIEKYSLISYKIKNSSLDYYSRIFNKYLWVFLFISPLGMSGSAFLLISGVFKMKSKLVLPIILISNFIYYSILNV